jgi:hypothetical protein
MATCHFGKAPDTVILPYSSEQLSWLQSQFDEWTILLSSFQGTFDIHLPANRLVQFLQTTPFVFPKVTQLQPISKALTVFIDGSSNGRAAIVVKGQHQIIELPTPRPSWWSSEELYKCLNRSHLPLTCIQIAIMW